MRAPAVRSVVSWKSRRGSELFPDGFDLFWFLSNLEGRTSQGLFAHSVQHFISLRSAQSYLRRFRHCEAYEHFLKFYEALLADGVLHPAGILFGLFRFDASAEKQLCEKAMPLVNSAGDGASCVRQEEIAPLANGYIALLLEPFHGDAHARF